MLHAKLVLKTYFLLKYFVYNRVIIINVLFTVKHLFVNLSIESHRKANHSNYLSDTT